MVARENCYTLPEPSTSSISGVLLEFPGGTLNLRFDYDRDGEIYNGGIVFNKVRSHCHTAESHCPAWKIEASYDKLVKIPNSEMIKELLENTPKDQIDSWSCLSHYMIYFDGDGCYEIVAEFWESLLERKGALS